MPWDDSGNALLHGTGPTLAVLDPDGTPNTILDEPIGGSCVVGWSFNGPGATLLNSTVFTVDLYAGAIGPGPDKLVGAATVAGSNHTATGAYSVTIPILPNSFLPTVPVSPGFTVSPRSSPTPSQE